MDTGVLLNTLAGGLLLPPMNVLALGLAGAILLHFHRRAGQLAIACAFLLLALLSIPATAWILIGPLQSRHAPLRDPALSGAQAIVVLGNGRSRSAPEYGGHDQPSLLSLARLRYAASLHQQTRLPILVSGGNPDHRIEPEAALMARALRDSFKVPVRWEESRSNNTAENARYSASILGEARVGKVLLVTDAIHMSRSVEAFAKAGVQVVPAPTHFLHRPAGLFAWLPRMQTLYDSGYALHEWIGLWWYRLRDGQ